MRKSVKKIIALIVACLMLATLFAGCGEKKADTIKLGWMGSLTGDQAAYGTCESQTLKMLVEEKNATGGILGKQIELICYDTKGDAQEAVNVAKRLCAQDRCVPLSDPTLRVSVSPFSRSSTSTRFPTCPLWLPMRR